MLTDFSKISKGQQGNFWYSLEICSNDLGGSQSLDVKMSHFVLTTASKFLSKTRGKFCAEIFRSTFWNILGIQFSKCHRHILGKLQRNRQRWADSMHNPSNVNHANLRQLLPLRPNLTTVLITRERIWISIVNFQPTATIFRLSQSVPFSDMFHC